MKYEKLYLRSSFNYSGFPEFASRAGVDTDALRSELALESEVFTRNANIDIKFIRIPLLIFK